MLVSCPLCWIIDRSLVRQICANSQALISCSHNHCGNIKKPQYSSATCVAVCFAALTFFYWIASILFQKQVVCSDKLVETAVPTSCSDKLCGNKHCSHKFVGRDYYLAILHPSLELISTVSKYDQYIVTSQQQPKPQQQNNHKCSWVETKWSLGTTPTTTHHPHHKLKTTW